MMDPSPTSPDSPAPQQQPARLLQAEFSCPICQQVVVSIQGNELQYLTNHTHDVVDPTAFVPSTDQGTYASMRIYHMSFDTHEVQPGGEYLPQDAFLTVQTLAIRPNET